MTDDTLAGGDDVVDARLGYAYDADGNVTVQTVDFPDRALDVADPLALDTATVNLGEGRHAYCYDHAGRLLRWDRPLPTDGVAPDDEDDCGDLATLTDDVDVTAYSWDAAGNRLSAGNPATPAEVGRYGYDERNRLTTGPGGEYRWTPRATMLESSDGASAATYSFDGLGRQVARGGVTYAFDGLDRIAVRTAADADSPTPATADFAYAGVELDPVDDNVADATTGTVDVGGRYARSPSGRLLAVEQDGDDARLAALNRHGDLSVLHDADGTLTDTRVWDPFGGQAGVSGTTLPSVGFQADWTDPASGQVWMGARLYDPANATFSARDTYGGELTTPVTLNRYTYATNNPLVYFDPDGRRVIASSSMRTETREQRAASIAHANGDDVGQAVAKQIARGVPERRDAIEQQALIFERGSMLSEIELHARNVAVYGREQARTSANELLAALRTQRLRHLRRQEKIEDAVVEHELRQMLMYGRGTCRNAIGAMGHTCATLDKAAGGIEWPERSTCPLGPNADGGCKGPRQPDAVSLQFSLPFGPAKDGIGFGQSAYQVTLDRHGQVYLGVGARGGLNRVTDSVGVSNFAFTAQWNNQWAAPKASDLSTRLSGTSTEAGVS